MIFLLLTLLLIFMKFCVENPAFFLPTWTFKKCFYYHLSIDIIVVYLLTNWRIHVTLPDIRLQGITPDGFWTYPRQKLNTSPTNTELYARQKLNFDRLSLTKTEVCEYLFVDNASRKDFIAYSAMSSIQPSVFFAFSNNCKI